MASSALLVSQHYLESPITTNESYNMNGQIIISALAILFFIVFIIILLRLYAKWLRRRSFSIRSHGLHHSLNSLQDSPLTGAGLDKETVEALPIFTYKSPSLSKADVEAVECAVCLLNFRQDENCKLLPKCQHFFHIDCIDMWLLSNMTCPLCRAAADPSYCGEGHDAAGSMLCCLRNQDGVNELREQHQGTGVPTLGTRDDLACDNGNYDREKQGDRSRDTLLPAHFSLQSPTTSQSCRRSMSEKFSHSTQDAPLPTNGLFWGNPTHMTSPMNPTHWQTGGRSFSHITIDIFTPQEGLVAVSSCPALRSSPELCSNLPHLVHRSVNELKSLKRLPSK